MRAAIEEAKVAAVRAARAKGRTFRELGSEFGISFSAAHRIAGDIAPGHRTKGNFKHLVRTQIWTPTQRVKRASKYDALVGEIRAARQSGLSFRQIAKKFSIALGAAHHIAGDIKVDISRSRYAARAAEFLAARKLGLSYREVAEQFDVSPSIVWYALKGRDKKAPGNPAQRGRDERGSQEGRG